MAHFVAIWKALPFFEKSGFFVDVMRERPIFFYFSKKNVICSSGYKNLFLKPDRTSSKMEAAFWPKCRFLANQIRPYLAIFRWKSAIFSRISHISKKNFFSVWKIKSYVWHIKINMWLIIQRVLKTPGKKKASPFKYLSTHISKVFEHLLNKVFELSANYGSS